jgi:hypothetical protein
MRLTAADPDPEPVMPNAVVTLLLIALFPAAPAGTDTARSDVRAVTAHQDSRPLPDAGRLLLSPAAGPVRVPFDLVANHIYLRGRVNDSDSLWVVLDSGAGGNVIDAAVAKAIGLEATSTGRGRGAGGEVEAGQVPSVTVKLPGVTLEDSPIATMPLESFRRRTGRAMDVIVGAPLIRRCVLRVDYAAQVLEFLPAETFDYQGKGAIVPVTFRFGHPYITARVTLPGGKPIEGQFVVDLGSSQAVILTPTFAEKNHALEALGRTIEGRGLGVGGQLTSRIGRIASVEVGGVTFQQPITGLPGSAQNYVAASDAIGNIGGEIMRRFTVTLDYARERMILEPNAQIGEPFEADMSGLGLRMGPDGSNALEVDWIQPDSPASQAGVQPQDLIEKVDGKGALELGMRGMRELSRRNGERHVLSIRRGDRTMEIALTYRRMI